MRVDMLERSRERLMHAEEEEKWSEGIRCAAPQFDGGGLEIAAETEDRRASSKYRSGLVFETSRQLWP